VGAVVFADAPAPCTYSRCDPPIVIFYGFPLVETGDCAFTYDLFSPSVKQPWSFLFTFYHSPYVAPLLRQTLAPLPP